MYRIKMIKRSATVFISRYMYIITKSFKYKHRRLMTMNLIENIVKHKPKTTKIY